MELTPIQQLLIQSVMPIVGTLISTLLTVLLGYFASYMKQKYQNEKIQEAIQITENAAYDVVMGLEQTVVSDLLKASSDGKLTEEDKIMLKNNALVTLKSRIKPHVKNSLQLVYDNLDKYFEDLLETTVKEVKTEYPRKNTNKI
ncbi:hypothetical protein [Thermosipho sp. (in: thermotogales)]|uniref:hypothetical protein n=1 Tax=Thermosipho sp. (in: thermotogales) TaxID=1968895 RepID=UPI00257F30A5|nr:hypothetical protein [Thermosipho sp. (in: thermotogales)]MBZ4649160.1 hypothetical protein [Thermosipho sp. (in: thermotogales)]